MIAAVMAVGVVICILPGCTRREQLVLEVSGKNEAADESGREEQDLLLPADTVEETKQAAQRTAEAEERPEQQAPGQTQTASDERMTPPKEETICVHVCGAVGSAGVYELPTGSRVFEAVEMAGGFTADADESYVNQAQRLSDGDKLVIPTREQVQDVEEGIAAGVLQIGIVEQPVVSGSDEDNTNGGLSSGSGAPASASDGRININTASEAQLCEIPGIGAVRAAAIVAYRQEAGGFSSIEDIMNVSGIKEGTFARIKDRIKVN